MTIGYFCQDVDDLADRTIFRFPSEKIETLEYRSGSIRIVIAQEMDPTYGRVWKPRIPVNYDLDDVGTWQMNHGDQSWEVTM